MSKKYKNLVDPPEHECKALLNQLRLNDYGAFNKIYDLYYTYVRTYAQKFVPVERADEVTHEVFIRLWKKRDFNNWNHLLGFMYRTTRNYCLTLIKKEISESKNRKEYALHLVADLSEDQISIHDQILHMVLRDAIDTELSGKKKKTVELLMQGYSINEVADKLKIAKRTAQNYTSLAFAVLRQKLGVTIRLLLIILAQNM
jgi:RNA polymerase sigma factor (sigma-70 family)